MSLYEIRIHARAGQGAETAAQLIAETAFRCGRQVQAFPSYGPERTGAPMQTFVRLSADPIRIHSSVYRPSAVLVIDPTLLRSENVIAGLDERGWLIVNDARPASEIKTLLGFPGHAATIAATPLAQSLLGKNLPNMAVLAVAVRAARFIDPTVLRAVVQQFFTKKYNEEIGLRNIELMEKAVERIRY